MNTTKRILAGVTENNELYFLEASITDRNGYDEFTMSGFTVTPVTEEDKEAYEANYLEDEGHHMWQQAVEAGTTYDSMEDWLEQVRDEGDSMDCSLYSETAEHEGTTYYFESQACGQHEENNLTHYTIKRSLFNKIMKLWHTYHMKPVSTMTTDDKKLLDEVMSLEQDEATEVVKAIGYIENN